MKICGVRFYESLFVPVGCIVICLDYNNSLKIIFIFSAIQRRDTLNVILEISWSQVEEKSVSGKFNSVEVQREGVFVLHCVAQKCCVMIGKKF